VGSHCIYGAVKQRPREAGTCNSAGAGPVVERPHRAGCRLLSAPAPGGDVVPGVPAPATRAGRAGGTAVPLLCRLLSLTSFCGAFAAVVLLSDPEASAELPGAASLPAAVSWGWGRCRGGAPNSPDRGVLGRPAPLACRAPAGDGQSPSPSSAAAAPPARSSASRRVPRLFTLRRRAYAYGGYVCLQTPARACGSINIRVYSLAAFRARLPSPPAREQGERGAGLAAGGLREGAQGTVASPRRERGSVGTAASRQRLCRAGTRARWQR